MKNFKLKYIFIVEAFLFSLGASIYCAFFPKPFFKQLTGCPEISNQAVAMVQWYSVLLFLLFFTMISAIIIKKNVEATVILLTAMLIGDLMHIIVTFTMADWCCGWTFGLYFSIGVSLVLAPLRLLAVIKPNKLGI